MSAQRILLVDDDARALEALATSLAFPDSGWELQLAHGAEAALDAISRQRFAAVVCDLQMPRKNGAAVLDAVRHTQPDAIRVILAGPTEITASVLAMHVAHQFVGKPCPPALLREQLARALRFHAELGAGQLREVVCGVTTLPSPPRVFQVLTSALADPDTDIADVVQILRAEIGLCTKVLQLANSSVFGLPRPLADIKQAVTYLGLRTLKHLVLGAEVYGGIESLRLAREFDLGEEQAHAMAIARLAAEVIAPDPQQADLAFTAAMLHDIGELVLAGHMPDVYRRTKAVVAACRRGEPLSPPDRELLDLHARAGGYLAGVWGLPEPVVEAVLHHHRPSQAAPHLQFLAGIVHAADCLCHALAEDGDERRAAAFARLVDRDWLSAAGLTDRIVDWIERAGALGLERSAVAALA